MVLAGSDGVIGIVLMGYYFACYIATSKPHFGQYHCNLLTKVLNTPFVEGIRFYSPLAPVGRGGKIKRTTMLPKSNGKNRPATVGNKRQRT